MEQKLVELISALQTTPETLDRARAFAVACGKGNLHSFTMERIFQIHIVQRSQRQKMFQASFQMRY